MYYAKRDNGMMLISETENEGYKPMVQTEAPEPQSGYEVAFYWEETNESWVQTWEIIPEDDEINDSEALEILLGGAS